MCLRELGSICESTSHDYMQAYNLSLLLQGLLSTCNSCQVIMDMLMYFASSIFTHYIVYKLMPCVRVCIIIKLYYSCICIIICNACPMFSIHKYNVLHIMQVLSLISPAFGLCNTSTSVDLGTVL